MIKKKIFLRWIVLLLFLILIAYLNGEEYPICHDPMRIVYGLPSICEMVIYSFSPAIVGILLLPILFFIREEVLRTWARFGFFWTFITMIAVVSGWGFFAVFLSSVVFLPVSLLLIIGKTIELRKK